MKIPQCDLLLQIRHLGNRGVVKMPVMALKKALRAEINGKNGRFPGLPATGDMQLLFMQHAITKMQRGKGRAAIITNGSPLFSGNTTSGESQIRRYLLENDLVEAIVGLPSQLFYNTDIAIYAFILSKNKRKGGEKARFS